MTIVRQNRYPMRFAFFLSFYYMANSIYQGFLSVYFDAELKLTSSQIGTIFACVAAVSIISQPIWGSLGDRVRSRNRLLRCLCAGAAAMMLFLLAAGQFASALILTAFYAVFYMSVQPMGDSIILGELNRSQQPFGPIRLCGSITFCVCSMVFGKILEATNNQRLTLFTIAFLLLGALVSTFALPYTPGKQSSTGKKMGYLTLLKDQKLVGLLVFVFLLMSTLGYFYTFFSLHFRSLPGADSALLGLCYFISAVCEIPFLLFSDRFFKKFGAGKLMLISALVLTARWIILGITENYRIVMASQALHGFTFIVITVSVSRYISLTVPEELKASGQLLLGIVSAGLPRLVGNFGGYLCDFMGGTGKVFFLCAGISLAAFLVFFPRYAGKTPLNGEQVSSKEKN